MQEEGANNMKIKKQRIADDFTIVMPGDQDCLYKCNYKLPQLKIMCKHYRLTFSGINKKTLIEKLFCFLKQTHAVKIIKKIFQKFMIRKYILAKGPAYIKRGLCVNDTDFYTMDNVSTIEYQQFISYTDKDTKIYGFDVLSLHNLVSKGSGPVKNPYNRNEIPQELLDNMKFVFNFSHIYFKKIEIVIEPPVVQDSMKVLELECIALFQEINALGNYAEHTWLWSLSKNKLTKFINYIADIWAYRANLTNEMKRNICPPNGDPFAGLSLYYIRTMDLLKLRKTCLSIIRSIVLKSSDRGDRTLGANYVLCAITLVNTEAAISLPWLYQSVAYY